MSIVRIINGKNNELHRMKTMVDYLNDSTKQVWQDEELSKIDLVRSYGVTFENAFLVFKSMHYSYGYPGTRLYYHILISFDDEKVDPLMATEVGFEINDFWKQKGVQFVQGTHCIPTPHCHTILNAILPLTGKKLSIRKNDIFAYKIFANEVLKKYSLNLIKMYMKEEVLVNE